MTAFEIDAKITGDKTVSQDLLKKAGLIAPHIFDKTNKMLLFIQNNVQLQIPRGQHCPGEGKGGTTKSAIRHKATSDGGYVDADEGIAPWWKIFVDGRGAIFPRNYGGTYLGKNIGTKKRKVLHFCIKGKHIFVRHAGPAKGNDVMVKGGKASEPEIQRQAAELGSWLEKIGG